MDAKKFKRGDIERLRDEAQNCSGAGVKWMTITERPEAIAELAKIALAALPSDAAQAPEPDCWAILTPNGSRLVSPEEAKGRRDAYPLYAAPVAADAAAPSHTDDAAVDEFAAVMKEKLAQARAKGRGGWETCNPADLSRMLREHVEKGDPRDVANFCMFLHALGHSIQVAPSASPAKCDGNVDNFPNECSAPCSPSELPAMTDAQIEAMLQLREHEPTIFIEDEILSNYDEIREEVWEAIKAYADIHARAALQQCRALLSEKWRKQK